MGLILGLCTVYCVVALGSYSRVLPLAYGLVYGANTCELHSWSLHRIKRVLILLLGQQQDPSLQPSLPE